MAARHTAKTRGPSHVGRGPRDPRARAASISPAASVVNRSLLLLGADKNYNNNRKEKKKWEEENAVAHGLLFFFK